MADLDVTECPSNGPCWQIVVQEPEEVTYTVWAPRTREYHEAHKDIEVGYSLTSPTRSHWAASWSSHDGLLGDYRSGEVLAWVTRIFPEPVREAFRRAIENSLGIPESTR